MDIDFEIEAKNWKKVHEHLSSKENLSYSDWYRRGVCAAALTTEDDDKSTEAKMCFAKLDEVKEDGVDLNPIEYTTALNSTMSYWMGRFTAARNGEMQKDKPDDVNYGLQVMAGDLAVSSYASQQSEKIATIASASLELSKHLSENKSGVRAISTNTVSLIKTGFNKTFSDAHKATWDAALSSMGRIAGIENSSASLSTKEENPYAPFVAFLWIVVIIMFIAILAMG